MLPWDIAVTKGSQTGCIAMLTFENLWNLDFKIGFLHLLAQLWRQEGTSGALTLLLRFGQRSALQSGRMLGLSLARGLLSRKRACRRRPTEFRPANGRHRPLGRVACPDAVPTGIMPRHSARQKSSAVASRADLADGIDYRPAAGLLLSGVGPPPVGT